MSEKIDWSKAPDGYPLWLEDLNTRNLDQSGWHRDDGDRYSDVSGRFWRKSSSASYRVHERPTTPSWSGEGLPPVRAVCEYQRNDVSYRQAWVKVTVKYISLSLVVLEHFAGKNEFVESRDSCEFRPIRTPEQIEADEREAAIERACADIEKRIEGFNVQLSYSLAIRATIEAMIDKGYRKP